MPTYAFTRSREQLATKVLRKLGVVDAVESGSPEDIALVVEAMDLRLKELHALGVLWWQVAAAATDVAITSGNPAATISATDFLFPVTVHVRVGTEDVPVEIIDHRAYQAIPNKADQGEPAKVYISGSACKFWPTPDANYTAKLTYEAIAADTEASTAPDVRVESLRSLSTLLAGDLVEEFNVPEPKASRLIARAAGALETIRSLNSQRVDTSTVAPDWF